MKALPVVVADLAVVALVGEVRVADAAGLVFDALIALAPVCVADEVGRRVADLLRGEATFGSAQNCSELPSHA